MREKRKEREKTAKKRAGERMISACSVIALLVYSPITLMRSWMKWPRVASSTMAMA